MIINDKENEFVNAVCEMAKEKGIENYMLLTESIYHITATDEDFNNVACDVEEVLLDI